MNAAASTVTPGVVRIRRAQSSDVEPCGQICYDAFSTINQEHNFPPDFPNAEICKQVLGMMFSHPNFFCVVAEVDGKIAGSNCLDERSEIAGVGPITVDPNVQNRSVGRQLMAAVMNRADERKAPGVRLVQAAFHNRSLSLYTKLGFDVREPLSVMNGPAIGRIPTGYRVRAAKMDDLKSCDAVCRRVHGHDRSGELRDAVTQGTAHVVEFDGRITGYATAMAFFGHSVAKNNRDLQALISAAETFLGPGILVPTRNAELFRWALDNGLRVVEPMTLMTMGLYNEPVGAYLPSITF